MKRVIQLVAYDDTAGTEVVWRTRDGSGATTEAEVIALWRWLTGGEE